MNHLNQQDQARFLGRHVLSINDFTSADIQAIFKLAGYFEDGLKNRVQLDWMKGLVLATLFYEPSTRTRLSFETAMLRLGGNVIHSTGNSSSLEKGESFSDMGKVVSRFADIMVFRHPLESSIEPFAQGSNVPVINAGNGSKEHPTQALLDLYSIWRIHQKTEGLKIGFVGDLKYGRAAHSIIQLLGLYHTEYYFISHPLLRVPPEIITKIKGQGCQVVETENLKDTLRELDILYVTRVQKERFQDLTTYESVKNCYRIDSKMLSLAKSSLSLLHPLPRLDEIAVEVDQDPRAHYFDQVSYGVAIRMALLALVSGRASSLKN